ncbi:MAG: hypothetical protein WCD86_01575 [Ktedonobacteraceae bacterium]
MIRSLPPVQRILVIGLALTFIAFVADFIFDRSLLFAPYFVGAFAFFGGLQSIIVGIAEMREAHWQEHGVRWHQQPRILFGIVALFGAFLFPISIWANRTFSRTTVDRVNIAIVILCSIPLFLLFRALFYGVKRMSEDRRRQ